MAELSDLRRKVIAAINLLEGFNESRFAAELFGRDAQQLVHRAFAVAVPRSDVHPREGRQIRAAGILVTSALQVQWAHRLRGDAQSADYSDALDVEQQIAGALRGIADEHVLLVGMERRSAAEGWIVGVITVTVPHRYSLP